MSDSELREFVKRIKDRLSTINKTAAQLVSHVCAVRWMNQCDSLYQYGQKLIAIHTDQKDVVQKYLSDLLSSKSDSIVVHFFPNLGKSSTSMQLVLDHQKLLPRGCLDPTTAFKQVLHKNGHSNVVFVCGAMGRFVGGKYVDDDRPCMHLFCNWKGLVPLDEPEFPKVFDYDQRYIVDVIESELPRSPFPF